MKNKFKFYSNKIHKKLWIFFLIIQKTLKPKPMLIAFVSMMIYKYFFRNENNITDIFLTSIYSMVMLILILLIAGATSYALSLFFESKNK